MSTYPIPRALLGKIVDEVFDGACEDTSAIEHIYELIQRAQAERSAPVVIGLRRKGSDAISGLLPPAVAERSSSPEFIDAYDQIPLFDHTPPPNAGRLAEALRHCIESLEHLATFEGVPDPQRTLIVAKQALAAHSAGAQPVSAKVDAWRCFHCDEQFEDEAAAKEHFGPRELCIPACKIDIAEYRRAEAENERYRAEDSDLHREIHAERSKRTEAVRRAEEDGYAKGLLAAQPPAQPDAGDASPLYAEMGEVQKHWKRGETPLTEPLLREAQPPGASVPETMPPDFGEWFAKNYPGPHTITGNPHWHAPKIWKAARYFMLAAASTQEARG